MPGSDKRARFCSCRPQKRSRYSLLVEVGVPGAWSSRPPRISEPPPIRTAASAVPVTSPVIGVHNLAGLRQSWQEQDRRASALLSLGLMLFQLLVNAKTRMVVSTSVSWSSAFLVRSVTRPLALLFDVGAVCVTTSMSSSASSKMLFFPSHGVLRLEVSVVHLQVAMLSEQARQFPSSSQWSKGVLGLRVSDGVQSLRGSCKGCKAVRPSSQARSSAACG